MTKQRARIITALFPRICKVFGIMDRFKQTCPSVYGDLRSHGRGGRGYTRDACTLSKYHIVLQAKPFFCKSMGLYTSGGYYALQVRNHGFRLLKTVEILFTGRTGQTYLRRDPALSELLRVWLRNEERWSCPCGSMSVNLWKGQAEPLEGFMRQRPSQLANVAFTLPLLGSHSNTKQCHAKCYIRRFAGLCPPLPANLKPVVRARGSPPAAT